MNISIIGCGYVGAVTGACLADLGSHVIFMDIDKKKLDNINSGIAPIFEPVLDDLIRKNNERISTTIDISNAISESQISFICVGTPSDEKGNIDLSFIKSACSEIGKSLRNRNDDHVVVVKSTVVPGTTEGLIKRTIEKESGKRAFHEFGLVVNPEFLREGSAVMDFFQPDRLVIGSEDNRSRAIMEDLYKTLNCPKILTDFRTAEMIKYASNAFLATKISFANEIGNLCKSLAIDTYKVFEGVGLDCRINPSFFRAGIGFGGSCFPKDVRAIAKKMEDQGLSPRILKAVLDVNQDQPFRAVELLKKHIPDLKGCKIGVLGLAFKPDTDDIRESRAVPIVERLLSEGAEVLAYDPLAMERFREIYPQINYAKDAAAVLMNSQAIMILTEWQDFASLDYSGKIVIDGRRMESARKSAKIYEGVCW